MNELMMGKNEIHEASRHGAGFRTSLEAGNENKMDS